MPPTFEYDSVAFIIIRNNKGEQHQPKLFRFKGYKRGKKVIHLLFQNVAGGYIITYTDIDFITGDIEFSVAKKSIPKREYLHKKQPISQIYTPWVGFK